MDFNNSAPRAAVTPSDSPSSERAGFLHPFARRLARGALVALSRAGDRVLSHGAQALALAEGIVTAADAIVDGLDRLDGCAQPEAPAAVDLGGVVLGEVLERRLARIESAVEALAPIPVAEKRRSVHPCSVCGSVVVLVLEGAPRGPGDWFNGLCAGCRTFASAPPDAEVIP